MSAHLPLRPPIDFFTHLPLDIFFVQYLADFLFVHATSTFPGPSGGKRGAGAAGGENGGMAGTGDIGGEAGGSTTTSFVHSLKRLPAHRRSSKRSAHVAFFLSLPSGFTQNSRPPARYEQKKSSLDFAPPW